MKAVSQIMNQVFSQPTAPFRENWVLRSIEEELKKLRVPYFYDRWGNIISGVKNARALRESKRVALVAHTDHPGFHLIKRLKKNLWLAQWFGGMPPKVKGSAVAIYDPRRPGKKIKGKIAGAKLNRDHEWILQIRTTADDTSLHPGCFGSFDYPGFKKAGTKISTRAADDLAGVVIILSTLARLKAQDRKKILGVFTRAEEVGFRGALGLIYSKMLGPKIKAISLEASRQMEGARIGKGPVIRLGDKRTLFDTEVTTELDQAAAALQKKNRKFLFQRRIMNGGTCEASAFNQHGIKSSGIAVPLGNYHNQTPSGRPGPEFIDLRDVENAVALCVQYFKQKKKVGPTDGFIKALKKGFRKDLKNLNKKVHFEYEITDSL